MDHSIRQQIARALHELPHDYATQRRATATLTRLRNSERELVDAELPLAAYRHLLDSVRRRALHELTVLLPDGLVAAVTRLDATPDTTPTTPTENRT